MALFCFCSSSNLVFYAQPTSTVPVQPCCEKTLQNCACEPVYHWRELSKWQHLLLHCVWYFSINMFVCHCMHVFLYLCTVCKWQNMDIVRLCLYSWSGRKIQLFICIPVVLLDSFQECRVDLLCRKHCAHSMHHNVCVWCAFSFCCRVKILVILFILFLTVHHKTNFLVNLYWNNKYSDSESEYY